jgi:hypothetical protein
MNEIKLKYSWVLWYHKEKDNWTISGYEKIYNIDTIEKFWTLYNNWDKIGGVNSKHFFLMRSDVCPIWEDKKNINGGCWSFKVQEDMSEDLWEDLSVYLMCDKICPEISNEIMGLSICLKKNNNSVVKVWNNDSKNNTLKFINKNILNKWGTDIIYIAHMSN